MIQIILNCESLAELRVAKDTLNWTWFKDDSLKVYPNRSLFLELFTYRRLEYMMNQSISIKSTILWLDVHHCNCAMKLFSIELLQLEKRVYNSLVNAGIDTVQSLLNLPAYKLKSLRQVWKLSQKKIKERLLTYGLTFINEQ